MSTPHATSGRRIFLCYRRDDSSGYAGRLFDGLAHHYCTADIYMDVETIGPGEDLVDAIETAIAASDVLIILIGNRWTSTHNMRRLAKESDYVRLEIATAFTQGVPVMPVLVQDAPMPNTAQLPPEIARLSRLNAFELSDRRWKRDVDKLIESLEALLSKQRLPQEATERQLPPEAPVAVGVLHRMLSVNRRTLIATAIGLFLLFAVIVLKGWLNGVRRSETGSHNSIDSSGNSPILLSTARPSPTPFTNSIGVDFVWIPEGEFTMGDKLSFGSDEKPAHRVTFSTGFFMSKYEITQSQWLAVTNTNPSQHKGCGGNCPVDFVTWRSAQDFVQRLNLRSPEFTYRLPSEAEWEYACRAGTTGEVSGDLDEMAWYGQEPGSSTHPVGMKKSNAFGLFDMHGNVLEWCEDWYHENYVGAPSDGSSWITGGKQVDRVLRGGSIVYMGLSARSAARYSGKPNSDHYNTGVRLVAVGRAQ